MGCSSHRFWVRPALSAAAALALAVFCQVVGLATAQAQEPLPAVLPEVLFLVEDSARMAQDWDGDPNISLLDSRWNYARNAMIQVINNAPVGMTFGVALSADGSGNESAGFEMLAYPGTPASTIVDTLNDHVPSSNGERTLAESYAKVLQNWAAQNYSTPRSWSGGPFQYSCSQLIVIMIGTDVGNGDGNPSPGYFTASPPLDFQCNDNANTQGCYHDNVAHYAYNSFSAPMAGTGSVKTHTVLLDSDSPTISSEAVTLFQSTANFGQGLYAAAPVPGSIAIAIWAVLNDSFDGVYSNAAVSMTPAGDMLFASYFEVEGGHPLHKGHLLGWTIDDDPTSTTYGEILPGSGPYSEAWDAGQLLASRQANAGETNQFGALGTWNTNLQRTGYTGAAGGDFYSNLLPFDATSLGVGTDLTTLLVDELSISLTSNQDCSSLLFDYDYDCDSDFNDAQLLVDFIRGVHTATFLHTGIPRGYWKMGDTGHSVAVAAPSSLSAIATEAHFINYRTKLATLPSMVYVASNAGMLHGFVLDVPGHEGGEYWFYVPRAKASKDPTGATVMEFDGNQIDDLMRSGQTYVNDGRLTLEHVWLDGYMTGLTGCSGPGYFPGQDDGVINADGCEWHRVLVWAGGYGSRHVYALDVTNPYDPRFLWERTDLNATSGLGKGRAVGTPGLSPFFDASGNSAEKRWISVWGAGSQPPTASATSATNTHAHAAIYIHDVDSSAPPRVPTQYSEQGYAVSHPVLSSTDSDSFEEYLPPEYGLFGTPALADLDGDGSVDVGYLGDSMGYMFKVRFNESTPTNPTICTFATPNSNDDSKHLYYRPAVFFSQAGELLVYYGSGSPFDLYTTNNGGVYVRKDPSPFGCVTSMVAPCASTSALFDSSGFYRFSGTGEKLVGSPQVLFGRMFFGTHIPGSDPCVIGNSRLYGLNVESCGGGIFDITTDSYTVTDNLYTEVSGMMSEPTFANGRMYALNLDGNGIDANSVIDDFQVTPSDVADYIYSSWRHVF